MYVCVTVEKANVLSRPLTKLSMLLHGVYDWEEHEVGLDVGEQLSYGQYP